MPLPVQRFPKPLGGPGLSLRHETRLLRRAKGARHPAICERLRGGLGCRRQDTRRQSLPGRDDATNQFDRVGQLPSELLIKMRAFVWNQS
jgi:hypothetical protein